MTKLEFANMAAGLKAVYQRDKFLGDKESIEIWYKFLSDIPYEILSNAVEKYICNEVFPPTIADLRRYASTITGNQWSLAWNKLKTGAKMKELDYPGQYAYATIGEKMFEESYDIRVMLEFKKLYQEFCLMDSRIKRDIYRSGILKCRGEDEKRLEQDDSSEQLSLSERNGVMDNE